MNIYGTVISPFLSGGSCCSASNIPGATYTLIAEDINLEDIINKKNSVNCVDESSNQVDSNKCLSYLNLNNFLIKPVLMLSGGCRCSSLEYYEGVVVYLNVKIKKYDIYQGIGQIKYIMILIKFSNAEKIKT